MATTDDIDNQHNQVTDRLGDTDKALGSEQDQIIGHNGQLENLGKFMISAPVLIAALIAPIYLPEGPERFARWGMNVDTLGCLALVALIVMWLGWEYLKVRMERFYLTSQRLRQKHNVLNVVTDQVELYRVKDVVVKEPLIYRPFGAGHLRIMSSDASDPEIKLKAIQKPEAMADHVRELVETARDAKGVRELD